MEQLQRAKRIEIGHRVIRQNDVQVRAELAEILRFGSTRLQSGSKSARRNSRAISSASAGLSSTIKTRSGRNILFLDFRRLVQQQPVHPDLLHGRGEPLEVHRLDDVA